MASRATCTLPSVPFLNPTGVERPLAISRCVCDSMVRAPMAYQLTNSETRGLASRGVPSYSRSESASTGSSAGSDTAISRLGRSVTSITCRYTPPPCEKANRVC